MPCGHIQAKMKATMSSRLRSYTELVRFTSHEDRYDYLRLNSQVGVATFGFDRWLNQKLYTSTQWRRVRNQVIARDRGCDLGVEGFEIYDRIAIHHMNPVTVNEVTHGDPDIFDPEFLITVSHGTHNAIHYGDERQLRKPPIARHPGDTKLW